RARSRRGASTSTSTAACGCGARGWNPPTSRRSRRAWPTGCSRPCRPASARPARCAPCHRATSGASSSAVRPGRSRRASDDRAISSTARRRAGCGAPIPPPSRGRRVRAAARRAANLFVGVQGVDEVYQPAAAATLGLDVGAAAVMIHSGSRGLGYQVCDDALRTMAGAMQRHGLSMPDRQLACAPLRSPEGETYLAAMAAAANFAWANRQVMTGLAERAFAETLGTGPSTLGFGLVYDVCHNVAKMEEHVVAGRARRVCVHRKGATRAFPPGHPALPPSFRRLGQPVIIPGDMGRHSFVLLGAAGAMTESFGTTCHGAGRLMSRAQAKKQGRGVDLVGTLAA